MPYFIAWTPHKRRRPMKVIQSKENQESVPFTYLSLSGQNTFRIKKFEDGCYHDNHPILIDAPPPQPPHNMADRLSVAGTFFWLGCSNGRFSIAAETRRSVELNFIGYLQLSGWVAPRTFSTNMCARERLVCCNILI